MHSLIEAVISGLTKGAFDCPYSGIGIHGIEVRNPSFSRRFT